MSKAISIRTVILGALSLVLVMALACGAPAEQQPAAPAAPAASQQQQPAAQSQAAAPQQAAAQQPASQPAQAQAEAKPTLALPSGMSDAKAGGAAPTAVPAAAPKPQESMGEPVQADLRVAITPPYAENLLGWRVGGTNQGILQPMQEHLFQRDYHDWSAQPMLATDWSVSADGKTWTIKLREDVPFHHGEDTFGVSDFVFSFQLWSHPESKAGFGPLWNTLLGPGGDKMSWEVEELGTAGTVEEVSDSEMVWRMNRP